MFVVWKEINEWYETKSRRELSLLLTRDAPYTLDIHILLIRTTRSRDNRMTLDGGLSYRRCLPREILHTNYSYSHFKDHSIPSQPGSTKDTSTNESNISLAFDIVCSWHCEFSPVFLNNASNALTLEVIPRWSLICTVLLKNQNRWFNSSLSYRWSWSICAWVTQLVWSWLQLAIVNNTYALLWTRCWRFGYRSAKCSFEVPRFVVATK